jgi:hypothetical protein
MLGWCEKCGVDNMAVSSFEGDTTDDAVRVTYYKYDTVAEPTSYMNDDGTPKTTNHVKLCKHVAAIGDFMTYYRKTLKFYVYHYYYMKLSSRVRVERLGFELGDISLIMDYSEKLNKLRRAQVQSQHWDSTAMTLEVAVIEAYRRLGKTDADVVALQARLRARPAGERGKYLDEADALQKKVYYHCSSHTPQIAAVTTHNMEVMLKEVMGVDGVTGEHAKPN